MAYSFDAVRSFKEEITNICKPDQYNLILHKHLGDVFNTVASAEAFECTYGAKLHFIVRPQHEFIMQMFSIINYTVYNLDAAVKKNTKLKVSNFSSNFAIWSDIDRFENEMFQALFACIPVKTQPFVCESLLNNFFSYNRFWAYRWAANMGIEEGFRFPLPQNTPAISASIRKTLEKIAPLDKIVLFAPDAATAVELPLEFWDVIAERVHEHGYKIIVNSNKYKINHGISAFELGFSLADVVAIGLSCAYVFSLRSGLCDALVGTGERLYAFYPAMLHREMNGLNKCFEPTPNVHEIAIWRGTIDKVLWEGEDLTKPLQRIISKLHRAYKVERIKAVLSLGSNSKRKRHKFYYNVFKDLCGKPKGFKENNIENTDHVYNDKIISIFGVPLFVRKCTHEFQGFYSKKYQLFGGIVQLKTFAANKRLRLRILSVPIFVMANGASKLFGITIHKQDFTKKSLCKLQRKIDKKYDDIYILRHNIGESYVELLHLAQALKVNKSKKPLLVCWDKRYASLYRMFLPKNMDMQFINIHQDRIHDVFATDTVIALNGQRFICRTPRIAESMKEQLPTWSDVNFYEYINSAAAIPKGSKPASPNINHTSLRWVEAKIKRMELKEPFVVLCPEVTSILPIKDGFWQTLALGLRQKGYDVFVNSTAGAAKLEGTKSLQMNLEELFTLAQRSAGIITMASGLAVFLTAAGVKMDLLYTDFAKKRIGYDAALAMQTYSVLHLPGVSSGLVKEYDASKINSSELAATLLKRY